MATGERLRHLIRSWIALDCLSSYLTTPNRKPYGARRQDRGEVRLAPYSMKSRRRNADSAIAIGDELPNRSRCRAQPERLSVVDLRAATSQTRLRSHGLQPPPPPERRSTCADSSAHRCKTDAAVESVPS